LRDSVIEFDLNTNEGSGFTFESYNKNDFIFAIRRAINVFKNKSQYQILRMGAEKATMPGEVVCRAWL
jgi:starch synthase